MFEGYEPHDLSLLIDETLPAHWPHHLPFQRRVWNWYGADRDTADPEWRAPRFGPYFTETLLLYEHTGTHFDAPAHFVSEGPARLTGEQIPLHQFCGPLAKIPVGDLAGAVPGESPWIEPTLLTAWESRHRPLCPGDVVVFATGWDRFYRPGDSGRRYAYEVLVTKTAPGWPAPDLATIRYLIECGVRCVGTDAPSMGASHDGGPVHALGLGSGMVFVEALAHLERVPEVGAWFQFLPLKIARSSGGPGRAVAWVKVK